MDVSNQAAKLIASVTGVFGGVGTMVHGIGEILQGNVIASSLFIQSWTQGPIATYMDGDPAITLIANMQLTGWLVLGLSFVVIIYAGAFVRRKQDGMVLILFAITLLLVGGGVGPPALILLAGIAGLGINARHTWWRSHLPSSLMHVLAGVWPWIFTVCVLNSLFLAPGHVIAVYFFAPVDSNIFLNSFFLAVVTVIASIICGIAYDITRHKLTEP